MDEIIEQFKMIKKMTSTAMANHQLLSSVATNRQLDHVLAANDQRYSDNELDGC